MNIHHRTIGVQLPLFRLPPRVKLGTLWGNNDIDEETIMSRSQLHDVAGIKQFITGGRAVFTLQNIHTGTRVTYKVKRPKHIQSPVGPYFVSFLYGPDNTSNYNFIGTIWNNPTGLVYNHSAEKAKATEDSSSVRGIKWLTGMIRTNKDLPENFEFWHEGHCCVCGRPLTDPESIREGIGPVCNGRRS